MSRRIELELTSSKDDGSWTWRAAGARQPRGELDGSLLPAGAKVGDVLRADADFGIDGITVTAILAPPKGRNEPERLEVVGPPREFQPVTSTLARPERGERRRPTRDRFDDADRPRRSGPPRGDRPTRGDRPPSAERPPRDARPERTSRPDATRRSAARQRPAPPPPRPKPKKLRPGRVHRDEFTAALSPEQLPVAEQLFRGGMAAVRAAIKEQNTKARAEGLPEIPEAALLAIAEDLAPGARIADWLDRAAAAQADAEEIALRDLRAVVHSADDVVRDERTRDLATSLRYVLARRTETEQATWLTDVEQSIKDGRVVRALRLAARPPQPNEALPEELATRLAAAASSALTPDAGTDRWTTVLDAVAYSPVRRSVLPSGVPTEPGDALLALVRKHVGRVPAIAAMFGLEPPARPGPRPKAAPRRARDVQAEAGLLPPGAARIPPPPPAPGAPTATATETGVEADDTPASTPDTSSAEPIEPHTADPAADGGSSSTPDTDPVTDVGEPESAVSTSTDGGSSDTPFVREPATPPELELPTEPLGHVEPLTVAEPATTLDIDAPAAPAEVEAPVTSEETAPGEPTLAEPASESTASPPGRRDDEVSADDD